MDHLNFESYGSLKDKSISTRIHKLKFECRLHLQLCAIYSQLHKHKDAYEQAKEGVRLAHVIVRDQLAVCHYFMKKADFEKESGKAGKRPNKQAKAKSSSKKA